MDLGDDEFEKRLKDALKKRLKITVENGDFTDPNERHVKVFFGYHEVAKCSFNVKQKAEYDDY
jgi:hypothetical protein